MDIPVLAGLSAAAKFALEAALPKNRSNRLACDKCLLVAPVNGGDILAE